MKNCSNKNCENVNPQSESNFGKDSHKKDGLKSWCKDCAAAHRRAYGEKYNKQYYQKTKDVQLARSSQYYQNNKEEVQKRHSEYYDDNKDWLYAHHREWFESNVDKNREYHRKAKRKKRLEDPGYLSELSARRRAAVKQAIPKWVDISKIREIYRQARSLEKQDGIKRHVDHIVPITGWDRETGQHVVCGLHVENNLEIMTSSDNLHKTKYIGDDLNLEDILDILLYEDIV